MSKTYKYTLIRLFFHYEKMWFAKISALENKNKWLMKHLNNELKTGKQI